MTGNQTSQTANRTPATNFRRHRIRRRNQRRGAALDLGARDRPTHIQSEHKGLMPLAS